MKKETRLKKYEEYAQHIKETDKEAEIIDKFTDKFFRLMHSTEAKMFTIVVPNLTGKEEKSNALGKYAPHRVTNVSINVK